MITVDYLKQVLEYNPESGEFHWLKSFRGCIRQGDLAGSVYKHGTVFHRQIMIQGRVYDAHRLAFLYMAGEWPKGLIDHRDRDGLNNRWDNLREATRSQNGANSKRNTKNKSGFKGVFFSEAARRWQSQIQCAGQRMYLGTFDTPEAAHAAYMDKANELFGEFARFDSVTS